MRIQAVFLFALMSTTLSSLPLLAQEAGPTVLAKGLFSYQAPVGWSVSDLNLSLPVSQGPAKDGFAPNIHVAIVSSAQPLAQFVAANILAARKAPDFRLVEEKPFATAAGLEGTRVVVTETLDEKELEQVFYFFDGGSNQKIIVSAACLLEDATQDAPLFDASLKSFSLE